MNSPSGLSPQSACKSLVSNLYYYIFLQIESGFTLADVKSAIRRLLGGTYKGHGKDYSTIKRVKLVFPSCFFYIFYGSECRLPHTCLVTIQWFGWVTLKKHFVSDACDDVKVFH